MSARAVFTAKLLFWLALVAAGVVGIALLSGSVVGLIIGAFTVIAVVWDSASMSRRRPRETDVVVGEIDHDFGSTTQKLKL